MLNLRYFRHTTWRERGQDAAVIHLSLEPPGAVQINAAEDYLHDVQLRQQVAVGQG